MQDEDEAQRLHLARKARARRQRLHHGTAHGLTAAAGLAGFIQLDGASSLQAVTSSSPKGYTVPIPLVLSIPPSPAFSLSPETRVTLVDIESERPWTAAGSEGWGPPVRPPSPMVGQKLTLADKLEQRLKSSSELRRNSEAAEKFRTLELKVAPG
eukprot:TRINITY_DN34579_c0_g1_i1.p1 TRINITY_DN34579_c0_g1~~TRINITY_DN34579_c0_g1_i1.p1  ORF type:complete len:155 (-),score=12.01 TRINITY_DN34579_c0_g1_i1:84-548(-)